MKAHKLENGLYYSDGEIAELYRTAADKREQIKILAQLNLCSEEVIRSTLVRAGINFRNLPRKLRSEKSIQKVLKKSNNKITNDSEKINHVSTEDTSKTTVNSSVDYGNSNHNVQINEPEIPENQNIANETNNLDNTEFFNKCIKNACIKYYETLLTNKKDIEAKLMDLAIQYKKLSLEVENIDKELKIFTDILHK